MGGLTRIDGNVLAGVSATTLWTLRNRATEAIRSDGVIRDPLAVTLFDAIDCDYRKFGRPDQVHALRALAFDAATRRYLTQRPGASVVALAEGLQTSFWRLDRAGIIGRSRWYSIDLPPIMALRERLLPHDDRIVALAQSALDFTWMDEVDPAPGVFITAEGLLMYLDPVDAMRIIGECAARFPGGQMMFDSIPHWLSRRTLKGLRPTRRYTLPPMPFALTPDEALALPDSIPQVSAAREVALPAGRRLYRLASWPALDRIGVLHRNRPSFTVLEFGS